MNFKPEFELEYDNLSNTCHKLNIVAGNSGDKTKGLLHISNIPTIISPVEIPNVDKVI